MANFPILLVPLLLTSLSSSILPQTTDTINATRSLKDGDVLVSAQGSFELSFFSPGNSRNRYVGIKYRNIANGTVIWVANRETPLNNSLGLLALSPQGNLIILDDSNTTIWSSNSSQSLGNTAAQLLDSGNLVIRDINDGNSSNYVWQSFDYTGDTLLPGVKSGINLVTGQENYITSWRSEDDPSVGDYSYRIDPDGALPQVFLRRGSDDWFRSGPWNGLWFSGMPISRPTSIFRLEFVFNEREISYRYLLIDGTSVARFQLASSGAMQLLTPNEQSQDWLKYISVVTDNCDRYASCGPQATCSINASPMCSCLRGFVERDTRSWAAGDWSSGCARRVPLQCLEGEDFLRYTDVKLPDTRQRSWYNRTMNLEECREACLRNCSCTAYANSDIRDGGSGCIQWFDDLVDIRIYDDIEFGQDIYIRMAASEIAAYGRSERMRQILKIVIPICAGVAILGIVLSLLILRRRRKLRKKDTDGADEEMELPLFNFKDIANATNNFSNDKKLGRGGFGSVYKGTLIEEGDIAVKRLSKNSGQGLKEFKNEVVLIAKLQHRNLVKLLGCGIEGDERILVYEYMPNNSLDTFIFDQTRSMLLDWHIRMKIIGGIARGMLYLHQDSRLRIIHRDLKASNVLLDKDMNPKISDFGMARISIGDEVGDRTHKVVGTYGYMSPEYMVDGHFSVKSDVFSFGVLVLEIVSGRRNRGFSNVNHGQNLLGHAWILWKEDRPLELMNDTLGDSYVFSEMLRCIQVGLLCIQQQAEDRPNMSSVVLMLNGEGSLPQPKQPGFFIERSLLDSESSSNKPDHSMNKPADSTNEVTITMLEPR